MADRGGPKTARIPSWQQSSPPEVEPQSTPSSEAPTTVHESGGSSQEERGRTESMPHTPGFSVDDVRRFLSDPGVRDAPEEKKVEFLEAKGVDREIIDSLLKEVASEHFSPQGQRLDAAEFRDQIASTSTQSMAPAPAPAPTPESAPRDIPPVVTYPEFLVKPQKPPPLVTINRLVNTAYLAGSLGILFYGASEYLIKPMTATLTAARHDFAAHTQERAETLNDRLEKVVSKVPAQKTAQVVAETKLVSDEDVDSIHSDPTELFHRDVGVQTSPLMSRRSSSDSSTVPADATQGKEQVVEKQGARLKAMRAHLHQLLEAEESGGATSGTLEASVASVRDYLNGLVYSTPYTVDYGTWSADTSSMQKKDTNDAVSALRNEIRGVKGVLLSAKRFPGPTRVGA